MSAKERRREIDDASTIVQARFAEQECAKDMLSLSVGFLLWYS